MQWFRTFAQDWGDVASVLGLVLTLIGFSLTLWGQWKIRKAARIVARQIAHQLAAADVGTLLRLVTEARDAGRDTRWPRMIDRCQEGRLLAVPLAHNPVLSEEERASPRQSGEDLRLVIQYIENHRLPPSAQQGKSLPDQKRRVLDGLIATVGGIKGRLQSVVLEV